MNEDKIDELRSDAIYQISNLNNQGSDNYKIVTTALDGISKYHVRLCKWIKHQKDCGNFDKKMDAAKCEFINIYGHAMANIVEVSRNETVRSAYGFTKQKTSQIKKQVCEQKYVSKSLSNINEVISQVKSDPNIIKCVKKVKKGMLKGAEVTFKHISKLLDDEADHRDRKG